MAVAQERRVAFAGRFVLDSAIGVCPDKADGMQLQVAQAIFPGIPKCGLLRMAIHQTLTSPVVVIGGSAFPLGSMKFHYAGILRESNRSEDAARNFGIAAGGDLRDTGWEVPPER